MFDSENTPPGPPFVTACSVGCKSSLVPTDISLPQGPLRRCDACGQLVSQCTEEHYRLSIQEFDDPEGTMPKPEARQRRFLLSKRILDQIRSLLDRPAEAIRLLDVGCSTGYFLQVARQLGFHAEGIEPGERAVRTARAFGLTVHEGLLEDVALPEQSFDAVVLLEVVEHIRDALFLARKCNRLLRPGGICVMGTGNTAGWTFKILKARWEYLHMENHGGHISFFNPMSMAMLAERGGFRIESIRTRGIALANKNESSPFIYRVSKVMGEIMEMPARRLAKGHHMLVLMRKVKDT